MASNLSPKKPHIISIDSSSDEDEQSTRPKKKPRNEPIESSSSLLSLIPDRARLEAERLARRKALDEQAGVKPSPLLDSNAPSSPSPIPKKTSAPSLDQSDRTKQPITSSTKVETSGYWKAALKLSYNEWHSDSQDAIRAEDIIYPKHKVIKALVSSYVVDMDWLCGLFNPDTPLLIIKHGNDSGTFKLNERSNTFLCHPPMRLTAKGSLAHGAMHVKFFIIYFPDRVRVAISTGNAVAFDYQTIENSIWMQDFPLQTPQARRQDPNEFLTRLEDLLCQMGVPGRFSDDLRNYNFDSAEARLVTSIQGSYPIEQARYGLVDLADQVKALGLQSGTTTGRLVELECQGSSIGAYNLQWLASFHRASAGQRPCGRDTSYIGSGDEYPPVKIVYPTLETVDGSIGGRPGALTLFCTKPVWSKDDYPKHLFVDSKSKRTGLIMHVKMILGIFKDWEKSGLKQRNEQASAEPSSSKNTINDSDSSNFIDTRAKGFLYVGSHNFTPAAWGRLVGSKSSSKRKSKSGDNTQASQLDISNWELGVIMPLSSDEEVKSLPTWQRPAKKYSDGTKNSKIPWMQYAHRVT